MRADSDGKPIKYYEVELENVIIGSIDQVMHGGTGLLGLFFSHPFVRTVLFNDHRIPGVQPWDDHDNHFHVALRVPRPR